MEAINSISDFFRFVRISAREIALNHRRSFKNGRQHPGASGRRTRRSQRTDELLGGGVPKLVNYAYDPRAGVPRSSGKHVLQNVLIRNGRDMLGELSLDTNGFVLTNHELSGKIVFALAGGVRVKHGLQASPVEDAYPGKAQNVTPDE
jgi:hypothetical protein